MKTRTRTIHLLVLIALLFSLGAFAPSAMAETASLYLQYLQYLPDQVPNPIGGYRSTLILRNPGSTAVTLTVSLTNAVNGAAAPSLPESIDPYAALEIPLKSSSRAAGRHI